MFLPTTEINNPTWPGRDVTGNIAITPNGVNFSRNEHLHFCLKFTTSFLSVRFDWQLGNEKVRSELRDFQTHSRPQRPRSFWSAPRIATWRTSGQVQHRKSTIHGLPVTLRMLRVKSDKSDWFWSQSIVFKNPFKTGMSLDGARGRDSWYWWKGARPLGTRMFQTNFGNRLSKVLWNAL